MTAIVNATSFCGSTPGRSSPSDAAERADEIAACVADGRRQPRDLLPNRHGRNRAAFHGAQKRLRRCERMANPQFRGNVKGTTMQASPSDEVLIRREGRAGRITMNRPQALNALTHAMVGRIWETLLAWRNDAAVELVLLDGAGGRALCAGGDVRALYDSRVNGSGLARAFWSEEYPLNALIGRYPKPYVAIQDGIVMGGGIGLSAHARHRIVTERSRLAMPETGIGLIPDVGGTWLLAHAPGAAGVYLGLTGEAMGAADAIHARFSDTFVASDKLDGLAQRLVDAKGGPVAEVIAAFAADAGPSVARSTQCATSTGRLPATASRRCWRGCPPCPAIGRRRRPPRWRRSHRSR